jgi:DNA-binding NarL/FixJ family response regulator
LIADPHRLVAEALAERFRRERDIAVVGVATTPEDVLKLDETQPPHVVLLEVGCEGLPASELCAELADRSPGVRFVFLTGNTSDVWVKLALDLSAGYLLKDERLSDVVAAICRMDPNEPPFSSDIERRITFDERRKRYVLKYRSPVTELTARQLEVLRLIARGHTSREIAANLGLTPKGVESHKHRIMHNLKIFDRVALVRFAIREGVLLP